MIRIAILDREAVDLARGFNAGAAERELEVGFTPFTQLDHLYRQLDREPPALVYMHHTWDGVETSSIVEHIAARAPQSRVIIFTGRDINLPELIECVRSGVVDYWTTGKYTMDAMLRRMVQYCADGNTTLERLQLASAPTLQLAERASTLAGRIRELEQRNADFTTSLRESRRADHKHNLTEHVRTIRFVAYLCAFTVSWLALRAWSGIETWALLVFTGIVAVFLLFVDGKLASALVKWTGGSVDLRGADKGLRPTDKAH